MTYISDIISEDMDSIAASDFIPWDKLRNATILITGASGLIGCTVTNALIYASEKRNLGLKIIAYVRNTEKTKRKILAEGNITYIEGTVEKLVDIPSDVTYIIHAANPTNSLFFIQKPAETIDTAVLGTRNLLNLAKEKKSKGFVFLSSMEIYGHPEKGTAVKEESVGAFDTMVVRNCYPVSKLLCESMVTAFASEFSMPSTIIRLTQTFGPGVEYNDTRIFAEFSRCVIENKDIALHSTGKTERCYLYVADAVTAILTVLLEGEPGQAYTAANSQTYCSIFDMAQMVAHEVAKDKISVKFEIDGVDRGYANTLYMKLDTGRLENLGWKPKRNLTEMFVRMIEDMRCQ